MAQRDEISQQYQRVLGRDARSDELEFFKKFMKDNDLTSFEVGQILEGLPEAQEATVRRQGAEIEPMLAASDERILGRASDTIQGNFRRLGRPGSSGYAGAFAQAARDLALSRQGELAQFYTGQLPQVREQAFGLGGQAQSRGFGLRDERRNRAYQIEDFYRMQDSYRDLMRTQNRYGLQSALTGAGIKLGTQVISNFLPGLSGGKSGGFGGGFGGGGGR